MDYLDNFMCAIEREMPSMTEVDAPTI